MPAPRSRAALAAPLVLLALTACSGGSGTDAARAGSAVGTPPAPPAAPARTPPAPHTPAAPPTPPAPLTLAFAGDVHFARQLAPLLEDPATGLAELRPHLSAADVTVVNLETALTGRGTPAPKTYTFRAPPTALDALAAAGVDAVSMANNHAVDLGAAGLEDTLAARAASPVPVVGLGRDEADAYAPAVLDAGGRRVAVLAATQVPDWTARTWPARGDRPGVAVSQDPDRLVAEVRAARAAADVVVVYLHWGTDYTACPDDAQRRTAQALAEAGADVVVGAHAHRVQGTGWLGSTYVAYGLGNFVWYSRNSPQESATGVLTLTLQGRQVVGESWLPLEVSADGVPRPPSAARAAAMDRDRQRARDCADLAAAPG